MSKRFPRSATSGGSESIVLALKTAHEWARATKGIAAPNIVIPRTTHPTFDRAAQFLGIRVALRDNLDA